ncbi:DUF4190 domain-containing protein [Nocardia iowensis]|uniref:DUF4190 domain-containing protein n=1 Tax=Nocardia iowensis TaxID=204891 RepID=A0ABX8S3H9_NOCIO|nr:DUF4190 domain-containing protein [Nocardia iowensis]QXN95160.1 DUF4190 domain-containing protein [Nocardia iowensis]
MARADRRESERWPAAQQDDRWPAAEEEQWVEPEPDERWQEPAAGRRRTGRLRVEIPPIVNPYAIVALVAALVGLFPVAIVFGFIAFSHPRGRVMAMFALLIGVAEVTALAGLVVLSGNMLPDSLTRADRLPTTASLSVPSSADQLPPPTTSVAPNTVATTTAGPTTTKNQSNLKKGAACTEAQVGQIGSAADGGTLICLLNAGSGYQWSGPFTVSTAIQQAGAKCDGSTGKTGRTADGRALVCETGGRSGTWVLWTE